MAFILNNFHNNNDLKSVQYFHNGDVITNNYFPTNKINLLPIFTIINCYNNNTNTKEEYKVVSNHKKFYDIEKITLGGGGTGVGVVQVPNYSSVGVDPNVLYIDEQTKQGYYANTDTELLNDRVVRKFGTMAEAEAFFSAHPELYPNNSYMLYTTDDEINMIFDYTPAELVALHIPTNAPDKDKKYKQVVKKFETIEDVTVYVVQHPETRRQYPTFKAYIKSTGKIEEFWEGDRPTLSDNSNV
jgi:hypothetical protein